MVEAAELPFVTSKLHGYVKSDFNPSGGKFLTFAPVACPDKWDEMKASIPEDHLTGPMEEDPDCKIYNARELQAKAASVGEFFREHGFALIDSKTKVKEWNTDYFSVDNDITNFYHKEIEQIVRTQLYPGDLDKNLHHF